MMESVGFEKGLIRYDSENGIKNKIKLAFTTRMKAYSVVLAVLISVEVFLLVTRSDYDATIIRAKGMLYQAQPNDQVSNLFTIKLVNKTRKTLPVEIKIEGVPGSKIEMVGRNLEVRGERLPLWHLMVFWIGFSGL